MVYKLAFAKLPGGRLPTITIQKQFIKEENLCEKCFRRGGCGCQKRSRPRSEPTLARKMARMHADAISELEARF